MSRRANLQRLAIAAIVAAVLTVGAGCEREQRTLHVPPYQATTTGSSLAAPPRVGGAAAPSLANEDESNSYAISQGKLLFNAYNCSGCHAQGGGANGPALMDAVWIYGADPQTVFESIVRGRPNGMPPFGDRVPEYQVWQLVAYVRSMTGLVSGTAAPGRNDAMQAKISEQLADEQPPRVVGPALDAEPPK